MQQPVFQALFGTFGLLDKDLSLLTPATATALGQCSGGRRIEAATRSSSKVGSGFMLQISDLELGFIIFGLRPLSLWGPCRCFEVQDLGLGGFRIRVVGLPFKAFQTAS